KKVEGKIRPVFSHEFVSRADGLTSLSKSYGLDFGQNKQSLEHSLAYEAVANGSADIIDVYSTDPKIKRLDLVILEDNLRHFPRYEAVWLARKDFVLAHPEAWAALRTLEGSLSEDKVIELNAQVEIDKVQVPTVIQAYVQRDDSQAGPISDETGFAAIAARIWLRTKEHLVLVGITLVLSIAVGVPLGILAARRPRLGQGLLLASSIVQTIPSLALLCFLIPVFGIGLVPALVALFLYSLLPVLMNTYIGLKAIDPTLIETAHALGLSPFRQLVSIELPIASPNILAGVKTATIISIGTATLAALIGAGGYGAPIVSGLAMNDMNTILVGAIPAAVMSLVAHFVFEVLNRILVPVGLQM
ncbi:MAG: ABC transporter permease subunit, partial [Proteobacteria bacterium]